MAQYFRQTEGPLSLRRPGPTGYTVPKPPVQPVNPIAPVEPPMDSPYVSNGSATNADIFQYLDPRTEGAKSWATQGKSVDPIGYHTEQQGGGEGGSNDVQVADYATTYNIDQNKLPEKYRNMVQYVNGGGASPYAIQYDYSKMPNGGKTVFGDGPNNSINQMHSLGSGTSPDFSKLGTPGGREQDQMYVKDKSQVKWDPTFGWITPRGNTVKPEEKKNWIDYGGMALGAGMGMFAGPALGLGLSGMNALRGVASGQRWQDVALGMAPGLIGAGMGAAGLSLPSGLSQAMKIAKYGKTGYDLYNTFNRIRG